MENNQKGCCTHEDTSLHNEASIQTSRILKILSDTVKNAKVALHLPLLLANEGELLRDELLPEEITFVKETCKKIQRQQELGTYGEECELVGHSDMCVITDLLLSKPKIVSSCQNTLDSISPTGMSLLRSLEDLRICVADRLKISPKVEAEQEKELIRIFQKKLRKKEELKKITEKLDKATLEAEKEVEEKKQVIKQKIDKITAMRNKCGAQLRKEIEDTDIKINNYENNSEVVIADLNEKAKIAQHRREVQLKENLDIEKDLRAKRYRIESQLVALIQKYDTDIGERHGLLGEVKASFEFEQMEMKTLQEQYDEQEREYENLLLEKELFEKEEFESKYFEILRYIAAKRIQRWWRKILSHRHKKKGKNVKNEKKKNKKKK